MRDCKKNKFLIRDGTNQQSRFLRALDSSYIQIDERSFTDLLKFIEEFATLIQYYNFNNEKEGNWKAFFSFGIENIKNNDLKKYLKELLSANAPHLALAYSFLLLFRYAQNHLNSLTEKHIEYYYKSVLRLKEKDAVPDKAHVIFTLAKHADEALIKKGTALLAGKDASGNPLYYKTAYEVVVNKARIDKLMTIYKDARYRVYCAPVANSADGMGTDTGVDKWAPFGKDQKVLTGDVYTDIEPRNMIDAGLGFAIASQVLWLQEGERTIDITLNFKEPLSQHKVDDFTITDSDLKDAFILEFTGKKGWIEKTKITSGKINYTSNSIVLSVTLPVDFPAIVPYDESVYCENFDHELPMVKIILNNDNSTYAYKALYSLTLKNITIKVTVNDIKSLFIQNNYSVLDITKTFQPYGASPSIGDEFLVGNAEAFQKKLDNFSLEIEWQNAPENFSTHYTNYFDTGSGKTSPSNTAFQFELQLLYKKSWEDLNGLQPYMFDSSDARKIITIEVGGVANDMKNKTYQTDIRTSEIKSYDPSTTNGFIKLKLAGPITPIKAFGHKEYPAIYTERLINKSLNNTGNKTIPNEPYTPTIKSLSISYSASDYVFDASGAEDIGESKLYLIGAFGREKYDSTNQANQAIQLLPQYPFEGALYIGIKALTPPQQLSLLFQVAEGSGNASLDRPQITWNYLYDNTWAELMPNQILMDTTQEFRNSGIISLDIPKKANAGHSAIDTDYYWLRASVSKNAAAINNLYQIQPQAVIVEFADNNNDPGYLQEPLPAKSITKLAVNNNSIKSVEQPFASFGGKIKEQSKEFFPRVSERLRHKNRAISIWDYEHLVLEQFPSVYKAKCLSHTDKDGNIKAGYVTLVVISNLYNKNAVDPLKPITSEGELNEIKQWLEGQLTLNRLMSPFVTLSVKNPAFEEIEVAFLVKFKEGINNKGFYLQQLNEDIKRYLSPWAYKEGADIVFEGKIHKSFIIFYIENLDYVEYITNFSMHQTTVDNISLKDIEVAEATRPDVILVSAKNHVSIDAIDDEECETSI